MGLFLPNASGRPRPKTLLPVLALAWVPFTQILPAQTIPTQANTSTNTISNPDSNNPTPAPTPPPAPEPAPMPTNSGPTTAALLNSMDALNNETKLNKRDQVSYRVVEEKTDPVLRTVTDSGELDVPLLGAYPAAGKTCKQLASELKPLLERDYFYKATVIIGIETISPLSQPTPTPPPLPGRIYFMGQVPHQGAMDLPTRESLTLSKAILLNGGVADFADRHKIKITRKKPDGTNQIIYVDLADILDNGNAKNDLVLQPGDVINVPEKLINF